ncbi:MAG: hypothetical protein COB09_08500 [Thalassobium sp.]|nr:MAG: hypothetical protein COB09_08500 [Thalassobium sp.]
MKFVVLCSTNGSVFSHFMESFDVDYDFRVVSDRQCGAIEFARRNGINSFVYATKSGEEFSNFLANEYEADKEVLFISFYTRLLKGRFLKEHEGRIVNFHPSILPACPGKDGFGDTIASGARFVGSTVHFIDEGMDTGLPLIQAAYPRNPKEEVTQLRHRVFLQQVVSLAQIVDWFANGRVELEGRSVSIKDEEFSIGEFSPNLGRKYQEYFSKALGCH